MNKVDIKTSTKPNARYDGDDFIRVLVHMSDKNNFFASATDDLTQDNSLGGRGGRNGRPPSAEWTLGRIRGVDVTRMRRWCRDVTGEIRKTASKSEMIKRGDTVAVDVSDIEYYGKGLEDYTRKTKPKNGTSTFFSYVMAQSVGHDYDIPLDCREVSRGADEHVLVRKMLKNLDRMGATPGLVLADRGFFSVEGINCLKEDHRRFVMPAVRNSRVKTAILKYHEDKENPASTFTIRNKDGKQAEFRLVIVEKRSWKESDEIADRYVVFATNITDLGGEELVETLPKKYRERWMIETGFRMIKSNLGKTCSRYPQVRLFLFYFALLLYGMWMFTKFGDANNGYHAGGDRFTLKLFMGCFTTIADRIVQDEKYYLEFVT